MLFGWALGLYSPAGLVSTHMSLDVDGGLLHSQVLLTGQPAADGLLDTDAGGAELVCSELLQVGHLASPEEDLGLAKLVLVRILGQGQRAQLHSLGHEFTVLFYFLLFVYLSNKV